MSGRHRYDAFIRFSDVDVYGHVNNVKYFEYYQEARLAFLFSLRTEADEDQLGLVVARVDVDYKRPLLFRPSPYVVESWVTHVGNSSFRLESQIKDGDAVLSAAQAVLVAFDVNTQSSRPMSEQERSRLRASMTS